MKNSFIAFFSMLLPMVLLSQATIKHVQIDWTHSQSSDQMGYYFNGAMDQGTSGLVPYYDVEFEIGSSEMVTHVELINIIEESLIIDRERFQEIEIDLKNGYPLHFENARRNGRNYVHIQFPTFAKGSLPNSVNKLISFDISFERTEVETSIKKSTSDAFATQSAMNYGSWHQFSLQQTGIYKLTYEQVSGVISDIANYPSSQIKMYGFGGMLPENNNDYRPNDIPEIAIQLVDGGDNSFNAGDYILFYGEGPDSWKYNEDDEVFNHIRNIYSRESFYYLVLSEGQGRRIGSLSHSQTSDYSVSSFSDYAVVEDETYNLINSGRRWFGDKYEFTTDYSYNFDFTHIKPNSDIHIKTVVAARSVTSSRFTASAMGESKSVNIAAIPSGSYPSYAVGGQIDMTVNSSGIGSGVSVDLNYNQPLTGSVGWLDYIELNLERSLIFDNGQLLFRNPSTIKDGRISEFVIQNNDSEPPVVWDITNGVHPVQINTTNLSSQVKFNIPTSELKEFIAFNSNAFMKANYIQEIQNQNLHAEINHDYIIITHSLFVDQANELADFHRTHSGLDVFVTTLEPIYHEFSSGRQDISAIRDFVRCVYENSDNDKKLKYLLLFGDASMDYLLREDNNTNMVPTWQSYESFNPISSLATDDFFGFLDENEGDFVYDEVNLGIGRFPVVNKVEAQQMVDKIKHYKSNSNQVMADWRNIICFIADDEDNNLHLRQANELSILVDTIYPTANLDKIFVDAYQQESTPAGQRYPKVNEAINERVDKGALIISYTGHGGEVGWGQERYLDIPDIELWTNFDKLPVFLTATCEFARYDDPSRVSAGELIFLNDRGGGISLFTTSRATYAGSNFVVSTNFYKSALQKQNGKYLAMGDILKQTKLASGSGVNVMKFILLGDPALTLNIPEKNIQITSLINNGSQMETDTIKALSNITIKGEIRDENQQLIPNFNGTIYPTIYDKPSQVSTLANDEGSSVYDFELQKNILYKGAADIVNGEFEVTFIVPKDISYKYGEGKISLYAENASFDAGGFDRDIIIGGFDENSVNDDKGPEITLFINHSNFVNGGITDENPVLLAYVEDENGINTTGNGIGHDISAVLDGNTNTVKILNDYYVANANSYKSGVISFPYFNLENGLHTLELKVWDIHNNSNKASIDFVVASSGSMALEQLFNYPNPIIDQTTFSFEHNQSGEDLEVVIDIYSIDGKRVTRLEDKFTASSYRNNEIHWDATDQYGSKISKGVYIYKVLLKSNSGQEAVKSNRLVVIK